MKTWLKILCPLLLVAAMIYAGRQWSGGELRRAVEQTRRELRQQGFKTELTDFNFTLPADISARANTIVSASQSLQSLRYVHNLEPMEAVGTNVALAMSPMALVETSVSAYDPSRTTNLWPLLRAELNNYTEALDHVCATLLAGPVKFQPNIKTNGGILLPYLAGQRSLATTLAAQAVLDMHEQNTNGMVTNLLGLSRLVTAWSPEPVEISHLVRFACASVALGAIWESMQTDLWQDEQLVRLQREWESAQFFDGLPETAELSGASMVTMCQAARAESYWANFGGWANLLQEVRNSPSSGFRSLWWVIQGVRTQADYRHRGGYEDERALLLYFRDRREEFTQAASASTWAEMRFLPGATNMQVFQGDQASRIGVMMNLKHLAFGSQSSGRTLIARAAETEACRRLIVTAIALERFALKHKTYPQSLAEVVPAFLPAVPLDFIDGKELRYQRFADGRYLLYSVGLDGVDNGGQMKALEQFNSHHPPRVGGLAPPHQDTDLVWPLRATQADVDLYDQQQEERAKRFPNWYPPPTPLPEAEARAFRERYGREQWPTNEAPPPASVEKP